MKYDTKKITSRAFLIYAAVNVFTYLFAHVAYLFANDVVGELIEYVSYYLSKTAEFLAPPVIAAVALLILTSDGKGAFAKFTVTVASARLFYSLPYYYIIFIYNHGYDSLESICLSLAASALVVLLTVLGTLVCVTVSLAVMRWRCRKCDTPPALATEMIMKKHPTPDFLAIGNTPILTFALLRFAFSFTMELIDTISFFIAYRSDYLPKEIITILVNFTLLFVLLVASYLIASAVRNALIKSDEEAGE
jgi:hypothetical protein